MQEASGFRLGVENQMMATTAKRKAKLDASLISSRFFAEMFRAFLECSDDIQAAIREMVEIVNDPASTEDEVGAALETISDALFPSHYNGALGVDLEECEEDAPPDMKTVLRQMDEQEEMFADRVGALLSAKNMTQGELASLVGIGQPAVSMMLSRNCRPQRRTVEKIASALDVRPSELWPEFEDSGS